MYIGIFAKFVIVIILFYAFVLLLQFFRDKFIKKENIENNPSIIDLLTILYKVFYFSGFGFVASNLLEAFFMNITMHTGRAILWNNLGVGIILIFIGLGCKFAKKEILKDRK